MLDSNVEVSRNYINYMFIYMYQMLYMIYLMSFILELRFFEYIYTYFVQFCYLTTVVHREKRARDTSMRHLGPCYLKGVITDYWSISEMIHFQKTLDFRMMYSIVEFPNICMRKWYWSTHEINSTRNLIHWSNNQIEQIAEIRIDRPCYSGPCTIFSWISIYWDLWNTVVK